jgi:hypothetical protein
MQMDDKMNYRISAGGSTLEAYRAYAELDEFRALPLKVRTALRSVANWLPPREASYLLIDIDASFAKKLRDRASRERGWRFGNYALLLLQSIIKAAVDAGTLPTNRVKQVPKLPPPRFPAFSGRRTIRSVRQRMSSPVNVLKRENSSA